MSRGLVIGKFMPPHAGHHFLIDTARSMVDRLAVAVREKAAQPMTGAVRARWLREAHPDVEVIVVPDVLAADDVRGWAVYTREFLGYTPDALFTSEPDGSALAAELGCEHVAVDPQRKMFAVSSAQIRAAPLAWLGSVTAAVRGYLVRRVCVVGSESTGKTTLCAALAARFDAPWVEEYGRAYTLMKLRTSSPQRWTPAEFVHIAREQQRLEDEAARRCPGLVVCDTDAFATEIWLERYLGKLAPPGWPQRDRPIDLYLLSDPDVPFIADEIRDGEHLRGWMFARFTEELRRRDLPFVVLRGSYEQRERVAAAEIERMVSRAGGAGSGVPSEVTR